MSESDDKKFTNKDLYKHLWEGRNFELTHFWQRSVFLTSIFVVLLAGYGKIIFAMYRKSNRKSTEVSKKL